MTAKKTLPPKIIDLPPSPSHRHGWPWTEQSSNMTIDSTIGLHWPRISVVTPSFNQGQYLEETIRSVLLQGYPNLEYIIIDGGSTDGSVEIIHRYAPWLAYWVSEPDCGQAHAINKGLARATGNLISWINSDDSLLPDALRALATLHQQNPDALLIGDVINFKELYRLTALVAQKGVSFKNLVDPWHHDIMWHQPGIYLPKSVYEQIGKLDESLNYIFDRDWLCRALQVAAVAYLHQPIAQFRLQQTSKTMQKTDCWFEEERLVTERYCSLVEDFDPAGSWADFEIYAARTYLSLQNFDRIRGIKHLLAAYRYNPKGVGSSSFLVSAARAFTPTFGLKIARWLHHYLLHLTQTKRLL